MIINELAPKIDDVIIDVKHRQFSPFDALVEDIVRDERDPHLFFQKAEDDLQVIDFQKRDQLDVVAGRLVI